MEPYKDFRDIILEYLLKQDIITGTGSKYGDQKPHQLTITGVEAGIKKINERFPGWIIFSRHIGGISAFIQPHFKQDAEHFLRKRSFTMLDYISEITDDEKIKVLIIMEAADNEIDLPNTPIETWDQNPKILRIINSLIVDGYARKGSATKMDDNYQLTDLGYRSALAGRLLPNPANQIPISQSVQQTFHGPVSHSKVNLQDVNKIDSDTKTDSDNKTVTESDSLFDKILKVIKEKPAAVLLLIVILILLLFVELFWPF